MQNTVNTPLDELRGRSRLHVLTTIDKLNLPDSAVFAIQDYLNLFPLWIDDPARAPQTHEPVNRPRSNTTEADRAA